jgi:hypothetical protein
LTGEARTPGPSLLVVTSGAVDLSTSLDAYLARELAARGLTADAVAVALAERVTFAETLAAGASACPSLAELDDAEPTPGECWGRWAAESQRVELASLPSKAAELRRQRVYLLAAARRSGVQIAGRIRRHASRPVLPPAPVRARVPRRHLGTRASRRAPPADDPHHKRNVLPIAREDALENRSPVRLSRHSSIVTIADLALTPLGGCRDLTP